MNQPIANHLYLVQLPQFRQVVHQHLAPMQLTAFSANHEIYGELNTISSRIQAIYNVTGAPVMDGTNRLDYDTTPIRVDGYTIARDVQLISNRKDEKGVDVVNVTTVQGMVDAILGVMPPRPGKQLVFAGKLIELPDLLRIFAQTALEGLGTAGVLISHPKSGVFKYYTLDGHLCLMVSLRFVSPDAVQQHVKVWGGLEVKDTLKSQPVDATDEMARVAESYRVTREGLRHFREDINVNAAIPDELGGKRLLGSDDYTTEAVHKLIARAAKRIKIGQTVNIAAAFTEPALRDADLGQALAKVISDAGVDGHVPGMRSMPVSAYFNPTSVLGVWRRNSVPAEV